MAHCDCRWTCGCAGKTVKSLENTRHTWALLLRWFTTNRRCVKCMDLYCAGWVSVTRRYCGHLYIYKSNISKTVRFRDKVTKEH